MHHSAYLLDVFILLLTAGVVVSVFRWFSASPVLGYLMGGVLIGPKALGFVSDFDGTRVLAQFGVVFLLFTIGLKMPLQRFQVLKRYVFGLGFAQVVVTGLIIAAFCFWLGLSKEATILIASGLSLSSTAVVLQLLSERGELAMRSGRVSFAILLFQDLIVVVLLVLISSFGEKQSHILEILSLSAVKAFLVLFSIIMVGRLLLRPLYAAVVNLKNRELLLILTLLVVLTTSLATGAAGLSMELGAFLAGLLLSETEYRHQVEADIQPFYGLLLGLFFMTVGMMIDLHFTVLHSVEVLSVIAVVSIIKIVTVFVLCLLFKLHKVTAIKSALLLAGGGEFVFIIFMPGMHLGLINQETAQIIFSAVAISMALTPLLAMLGKFIEERWTIRENTLSMKNASDEIGDLKNHIIIVGFGRVGRVIASILRQKMIPFVAIDSNMEKVSDGRNNGFPVFYGDAQRAAVLSTLGAEKALSVVVSISSTKMTLRIATMVSRQFPKLKVSVRMDDDDFESKLSELGVTIVTPDSLEPSLQLASAVLRSFGTPPEEISQAVDTFRRDLSDESKKDMGETVQS
ncbi:MAG: cation:proton antiporter domain-containing protein [Candidatus Nucleicultricaceae bacterium]